MSVTPLLYSFRRCPYAIRARMALAYAQVRCELREIILRHKPQAMLDVSPKGTVPVLVVGDRVIDESIDVMRWALAQNDPENWNADELDAELVVRNDGEFKANLDRYKYFDRFPQESQDAYFERGCKFLQTLETSMQTDSAGQPFLLTPTLSALDVAIFPFVRQFAFVDMTRFEQVGFSQVQQWLKHLLDSNLFKHVMTKYPLWSADSSPVYFEPSFT